jgi:hypothetical protein
MFNYKYTGRMYWYAHCLLPCQISNPSFKRALVSDEEDSTNMHDGHIVIFHSSKIKLTQLHDFQKSITTYHFGPYINHGP